ncbi:MAG: hypothetical protein ABIH91_03405 [Candidatus Omnitrophota bacterium]
MKKIKSIILLLAAVIFLSPALVSASAPYQEISTSQGKVIAGLDREKAYQIFGVPASKGDGLWYYADPPEFFVNFSEISSILLYPDSCQATVGIPLEFKAFLSQPDSGIQEITKNVQLVFDRPECARLAGPGVIVPKKAGEYSALVIYENMLSNPLYLKINELKEKEQKEKEQKEKEKLLSIDLLPYRPISTPGGIVDFVALGTFFENGLNKYLVKDISQEAIWFMRQRPNLAWDKRGSYRQYFLEKGQAEVSSKYKGIESFLARVEIKDKLDFGGKKLKHILLLPEVMVVLLNSHVQMRVFGTYNDNSVEELTQKVTWQIADPDILTLNKNGDFFAKSEGMTQVIAGKDGVEGLPAKVVVVNKSAHFLNTGAIVNSGQKNITNSRALAEIRKSLKKMEQSKDARELQKAAQELKEVVKSSIKQDDQKLEILEAVGRLKETLADLLEKKASSAKNLEKKIGDLVNLPADQIRQLQEFLKKMEQSQDARELQNAAQELKEEIKSSVGQDGQELEILEAVGRLKEIFADLLEQKASSVKDLEKKIDNLDNATADQVRQLQDNVEKLKQDFLFKEKELREIKITPKLLEIGLGEEGKFLATGIYNDGSLSDLTILGNWSTLNKNIATVSGGNVVCVFMGQTSANVEFKGISSEYARIVVGEPKLVSLFLTPQNLKIPRDGKANLKAQGKYSDHSQRDLTGQVNWGADGQVVKIENGVVYPLKFGQSKIYAKHSHLESNTISIEVISTFDWWLWLFAKITLALLLGIFCLAGILYSWAEHKRRQLYLLKDNPREFILGLYENAARLITIFGLRYDSYTFPLFYAALAKQKFLVENNVFLNFTIKFEEAKYSQHVLQDTDLAAALNDYNSFFEGLVKDQSWPTCFHRYCLALLRGRPIFIFSVPGVSDAK